VVVYPPVGGLSGTELVILGLLKRQPAHGYELLRTVRRQHMSEYIRLAPSGLYQALARLQDQECVTARLERERNHPERQTYSITRKGEVRLEKLLLDHLRSRFEHFDSLSAALTFGELAPREALSEALRSRRHMVLGAQEEAARLLVDVLVPLSETFLFERLRVERWAEHLSAERRWLDKAIGSLANGHHGYTLKLQNDEPERFLAQEQPIWAKTANGDKARGGQDVLLDVLEEEREDPDGE
jgi:DNA-binding PadR family transcriptional regulator